MRLLTAASTWCQLARGVKRARAVIIHGLMNLSCVQLRRRQGELLKIRLLTRQEVARRHFCPGCIDHRSLHLKRLVRQGDVSIIFQIIVQGTLRLPTGISCRKDLTPGGVIYYKGVVALQNGHVMSGDGQAEMSAHCKSVFVGASSRFWLFI